MSDDADDAESAVIEVGPIAHGGHCVARHEGRVIFVRHALPGERVRLDITDTSHDRFWRADAVEVLEASPHRVSPPCPIAGPGLCGGCDLQHADPAFQRELKARVISEQLDRLAGLQLSVEVEELPEPVGETATVGPGLGWRTRMRYPVDEQGRPGLRAHRSHHIVGLPAEGCRIAVPELARPADADHTAAAGSKLLGVRPSVGPAVWLDDGGLVPEITEQVGERTYALRADGFWQVHPSAAPVLSEAVVDGLEPRAGERALDLYCGVGLFAAALADAGCGTITGVEADASAVEHAQHNLSAFPDVRIVRGRVDRLLDRRQPARGSGRRRAGRRAGSGGVIAARADLVVLDPPRSGAGRQVTEAVADRQPRRIAYVACDPAALARDLKTFAGSGYRLASLRAFDLFPMTHHVECVAILDRSGDGR